MIKPHPILYLVGVALSIAQFLMIRDFVSILYGEEVTITLVTACFFLGLSVGYALSMRLSQRTFERLFIASVFLHLTFPFSYRYMASLIAMWDWDGMKFLYLLIGYALIFNAIFATFLPRLIADPEGGEEPHGDRMRVFYGLELAGFMSGFVVVILSWNHPTAYLLIFYWALLGVILHLTLRKTLWTGLYAAAALVAMFYADDLDRYSTELLYTHKHNLKNPKVLYSVNSPYNKVVVIVDGRGRRLYLDGLLNLNSTDLEDLNYYIAELPAVLIKPKKALIIGNGTLSSVSKVYPHAKSVVSVELDAGVLEAGRRFFTDPATLEGLENWELHVDDGKHFLSTTEDRFDLVIVDVPSPLTIQEAYLHSVEFYGIVASGLSERGVIAVQLSGPLNRNNRSPARITAALRRVFPEVVVIHSREADRSFAYASRELPFTTVELRREARTYETHAGVIDPAEVEKRIERATPITVDNMDLVLRRGWQRFADRYID